MSKAELSPATGWIGTHHPSNLVMPANAGIHDVLLAYGASRFVTEHRITKVFWLFFSKKNVLLYFTS
jgi:hypothetical protein